MRISDALVGGDEPSGDGFCGELDARDDGGFFNAVVCLAGGRWALGVVSALGGRRSGLSALDGTGCLVSGA